MLTSACYQTENEWTDATPLKVGQTNVNCARGRWVVQVEMGIPLKCKLGAWNNSADAAFSLVKTDRAA